MSFTVAIETGIYSWAINQPMDTKDQPVKDQTMTQDTQKASEAETTTYVFSARELARLATYRAAVIARFYNEQTESAEFPARQTLSASNRRSS